ncbi:MAG: hypothetical protein E2O82_03675 [Betaproteobacteria bacterium]|nr:MAG: hypothetical protein E2O82_03675 [Betaproteobacteria bacterium]
MNLLLSNDKDIQVIDGNLPLVEGIDELTQISELRFQSFQGDWFLDLDLGMPYFEVIFQKATSVTEIETIFLNEIGDIPGIIDVKSFNLSLAPETRTLTVEFSALTTDGVLDFSTEV